MGHPPTIFLYIDHECPDMSYSAYSIELPHDISEQVIDSEGFIVDSEPISPVFTFKENNKFLALCATVTLGSKVYFLGGLPRADQERLIYQVQVQVFDTHHPDKGLLSVAPMHAPKATPCLFVADGFLYALGSTLKSFGKILPGCKGSGVFERYDPISDQWQVLPDPPPPNVCWEDTNFLDRVTVVGRLVFIGSSIHLVFNLDSEKWEPVPPAEIAARFPYGSLFVKDSNSLYQLTSPYAWKPGTQFLDVLDFKEPLTAVKRGPLATTEDSSLLKDPCLDPGKEQVMAQGIDFDEDKRFTNSIYSPWRDLFYVGGRFFCYIVTSQLVDCDDLEHYYEPYSRGVLIKFFEEVAAPTDNNKTKFRPVASFCYKINTNFRNRSLFIRCSFLGTVPDSWINAPPQKKRQESKLKHRNKEQGQSSVMEKERQDYKAENRNDLKERLAAWINAPPQKKRQESKLKHRNKEKGQSSVMEKERHDYKAENSDDLMERLAAWINTLPQKKRQESKLKHRNKEQGQSSVIEKERQDYKAENSDDLKERLAARDEEIIRLEAELARKDGLLQALLAQTRGMIGV